MNGQKLGTVTSFNTWAQLFQTMAQRGSLKGCTSHISSYKAEPKWRDNNISLGSMVKLMRSFVISIFLYFCESWTLTAELEKRLQASEMRCYQRLLSILYTNHITDEEVCRKIQAAIFGENVELLTIVKKKNNVVLPCLNVFLSSKDNFAGHSEWKKEVDRRSAEETILKSGQGWT